jgi:hypothetical protein
MRKIEIDARMKSLGILSLCAAVFFVSIYMIITSINRYSVIGIQKENGRIEIETSENYLFMIPRGKETMHRSQMPRYSRKRSERRSGT